MSQRRKVAAKVGKNREEGARHGEVERGDADAEGGRMGWDGG